MANKEPPRTTVNFSLPVALIDKYGARGAASACLTYGLEDPYAIGLDLRVMEGVVVRWRFARDLLLLGMNEPAGEGDVTVAPGPDHSRGTILILLRNPIDHVVLELRAAEVESFLRRSLTLVPLGKESVRLQLDSFLAHAQSS